MRLPAPCGASFLCTASPPRCPTTSTSTANSGIMARSPMSSVSAINELDDRWSRIVGIPGLGIVLPNVTGTFGPLGPSDVRYWLGYAYFILLSFLLWHGNRWLLFRQRNHLDWFERPVRKVLLLISGALIYTVPLTVLFLMGWYHWAGFPAIDWDAVQLTTLAIAIVVVFVSHMYETVFLIKACESDMVQVARLERSRTQAELDALHSQIAPHFLFNSLNTLSHLIETEPDKARTFNDNLARVYRYILLSRNRSLVLLSEEMAFLDSYFHLLRLRFGDSLRLHSRVDPSVLDHYLLPPISLQIPVENAVKHNVFDDDAPLEIIIAIEGQHVVVANRRRTKRAPGTSSRIGLKNLDERCKLVTSRQIEILAGEDRFAVKIPIFRTTA